MYFDWMYLALVIPAMIFAIAMQVLVSSRYTKYGAVMTKRGITGYQAARMVLDSHGLNMVPIEMIAGDLTDNYDPGDNVLHLSSDVYSKASAAAVGIACHEAGHAIQHAAGYFPARVRMAIIPVTNIGSKLSIPLIIIGLIFGHYAKFFIYLAYIGIGFFALVTLFQLVTLPVEFDASRRALKAIQANQILYPDETEGARKVLTAAALTYVAALAVSLTQLLRFIAIFGRRR